MADGAKTSEGRCKLTLDPPAKIKLLPAEFAAALLVAAEAADSGDDAIVSYRLDGTIMSWSPTAERLYGWTGAETIGQNIEMIVPEAHLKEFSTIWPDSPRASVSVASRRREPARTASGRRYR